ncbi:hypothetical protein Halhy_3359 [Haliscomenobacter hydrossis DSM 1100]|uniref:Peptidase S1 and S6 chymotrypsin/Hap n=1 Tax=Haliscomenobacter hydrossis (strain ATCC 27775 / DSM 1100 / LMG 10767 / O) TaxID=760192 RepID=F4KUD5_HALH1|nr:hypothetical protein Halhy_3359 [Haliscomenobacter hydrossis DSM 1100]
MFSIPISLRNSGSDKVIAVGTGFFYSKNEKLYFITNWHNVTGINPITKEPLSSHGSQPHQIMMPVLVKDEFIDWDYVEFDLYKDESNCEPDWMVHPIHGEKIDVVVIEFDSVLDNRIIPVNECKWDLDYPLEISDDIFVLGYPKGLSVAGHLPIWKKASVASEPQVHYNGLPCFLIDTASREGMSGAPVIYKRTGVHFKKQAGKVDVKSTIFGVLWNFVGIYSGRIHGTTELDAQLGIVWKKEVIDEIIEGNTYDVLSSQFKKY